MSFDIIVTASYIPSHPSIKLIKKTIYSLHYLNYKGPKKVNVILAHDYSNNPNYFIYLYNLEKFVKIYNNSNPYFNLIIVTRKDHGHLAGNVRNALKYTKNEYLLIIQHDFPFCKNFNINSILQDMNKFPELKHVRFNKRKNIMKAWDIDKSNFWNNFNVKGNHNYISTMCWSDNNHLTRKSYYNNIIMKASPNGTAMEWNLNNNRNLKNHLGTYVYGVLGESKYIEHIDGREGGSKAAVIRYNREQKRKLKKMKYVENNRLLQAFVFIAVYMNFYDKVSNNLLKFIGLLFLIFPIYLNKEENKKNNKMNIAKDIKFRNDININFNSQTYITLKNKIMLLKKERKPLLIKINSHACAGKSTFLKKYDKKYLNFNLYDFDNFKGKNKTSFLLVNKKENSVLLGSDHQNGRGNKKIDYNLYDNVIYIYVIPKLHNLYRNIIDRQLKGYRKGKNSEKPSSIQQARSKIYEKVINDKAPLFYSFINALNFCIKAYNS